MLFRRRRRKGGRGDFLRGCIYVWLDFGVWVWSAVVCVMGGGFGSWVLFLCVGGVCDVDYPAWEKREGERLE